MTKNRLFYDRALRIKSVLAPPQGVAGGGIIHSLFGRFQKSRRARWGIGIAATLILVLFGVSFLLDEYLRSSIEKKINQELKGYSVRLPGLRLHLIGLSMTLRGLTIIQQAHPDPPVVHFPVLKASIHWREILSGRLVAEFMLDRPTVNINLLQLRSEVASTVPLKQRGWQQAVQAIYPLKINSVLIKNATVTYIDQDPKTALVLSNLNLQATNIRNIRHQDQVYPSSFHLETAVFDSGRAVLDGHANFLAEPHPGIKGQIKLDNIAIDHFRSHISNPAISLKGGLLRASGDAEYAPKVKVAHLKNLTIQGMNLEYSHSKRTVVAEKNTVTLVKKTARKLGNNPGILILADELILKDCLLGLVNKAAIKPYRVFFTDTNLHLSNVSNQAARGPAQARLQAKFMGSGNTKASADFKPEKGGAAFDLYLKIEETRLTTLNDLLRTYGDFDVSAGIFSVVTELHVKNSTLTGYIKPFFKGVQVYDKVQDKHEGTFHKLYERVLDGAALLLESRQRQEVATKILISGRLDKPETSRWQIAGELLKNAFFKAMLPTFDRNGKRGKKP